MRLQLILVGESQAIDALQLRIFRIATPVGAGNFRELERRTELAGGRQMRTQTQIQPGVALAIDGERLILETFAYPLGLERLTILLEVCDRLGMRPDLAPDRQIALHDLAHLLFDLFEIGLGERFAAGEVVVEAVLGRGAEGDLRAWKQLLHGLGHHVRGVVADGLQRLGLVTCDDADAGVGLDRTGQVPQLAIDRDQRGLLGQAGRDALRDGKAGDRRVE